MSSIPVCELCLEPISNFVCPDCLYNSVQQWVWKCKPSVIERLSDFHRKFLDTLVSDKTAFCVVCKREYYHMICPYDYMKDIYSWLEDYLTKKQLKDFLRIFSIGFKRIEHRVRGRFFYRNQGPPLHSRRPRDMGICENCENFSDNLKLDTSHYMVCEKCR